MKKYILIAVLCLTVILPACSGANASGQTEVLSVAQAAANAVTASAPAAGQSTAAAEEIPVAAEPEVQEIDWTPYETDYGQVDVGFTADDESSSIIIKVAKDNSNIERTLLELVSNITELPIPYRHVRDYKVGNRFVGYYKGIDSTSLLSFPSAFILNSENYSLLGHQIFGTKPVPVEKITTIPTLNGNVSISTEGNKLILEYPENMELSTDDYVKLISEGLSTGKIKVSNPDSNTVDLSPRISDAGTAYRMVNNRILIESFLPDENNETMTCRITLYPESKSAEISMIDPTGRIISYDYKYKMFNEGRFPFSYYIKDTEGNIIADVDRKATSSNAIIIEDGYNSLASYFLFNDSLSLNIAGKDWYYEYDRKVISEMMKACGSICFLTDDGQSLTLKDGTVTIKKGDISNSSFATSVIIPQGVKNIGAEALKGLSGAESISLPDSVTFIGDEAFQDSAIKELNLKNVTSIGRSAFSSCVGLESITLPAAVTEIHESAFSGCSSLKEVRFNENIKSIGDYAFKDCTALESVVIPDSVESIGKEAFMGCTGLKSARLPRQLTVLEPGIFHNCNSLEEVILPEDLEILGTSDGSGVFAGCIVLKAIELPSTLTYIGRESFFNCFALKEVAVPDSVTYLGTRAFAGCTSLVKINIPSSLTECAGLTFKDCYVLASITLPADKILLFNGKSFENCNNLILIFAEGTEVIPSRLYHDAEFTYAYSSWTVGPFIRTVILPKSLRTISKEAFCDWYRLESICYTGTEEEWNRIEKGDNWNLDNYNFRLDSSQCTIYFDYVIPEEYL